MAIAQNHFVSLEYAPGKTPMVRIAPLTVANSPASFAPQTLPHVATIDGKEKVFATAHEKFRALAAAWRWHNRGRSILDYDDFSYMQIIGMGPEVVPLLLKDVQEGEGSWYFALKCITNQDAETPDMYGDAEAVRHAWVQWGKRNGQLPL
jgi:hypothetical protein